MVCKACGTSFEPKHPKRARFCSGRCRVTAWRAEKERTSVRHALEERANRDRKVLELVAEAERAIQKARRILPGEIQE